jgi:hypothetical protein
LTASGFCAAGFGFSLGFGLTAEGITADTGTSPAAVGATETPVISIMLRTFSPESNDVSEFASVTAILGPKAGA